MLNNLVLVGKIIEVKNDMFYLEVQRSYRNYVGIYDADVFVCNIWSGIKDSLSNSCIKDDIIAIKGRLENKDNRIMIIVERVAFLRKSVTKV